MLAVVIVVSVIVCGYIVIVVIIWSHVVIITFIVEIGMLDLSFWMMIADCCRLFLLPAVYYIAVLLSWASCAL